MGKKLFITGTGTDVGKTYVTGLIMKKLQEHGKSAGYYKAAMSGNERDGRGALLPGDALFVKNLSGISQPLPEMCPYVYEAAVSPHLAAKLEGNPVRMEVVKKGFLEVCGKYDYVTMEGSGGILCPLSMEGGGLWLEDVARELGLSSLVVAEAGLGTINSLTLTVEYMRAKNLPVKGIVFNRFHPGDVMEEDNLRMCQERTGLPVVACVAKGGGELSIDIQALTALYED